MTTEIVKQHDVTQIDKLVATFSKLDPAATAAKWEELDGAVEKSIVAIDQKFDALGANLIKVRAFLSQMENPGRKNIIEGIVGFHLRLKTNNGVKGTRINFLREVQDSDEARKVLVEMVRAAAPKATH